MPRKNIFAYEKLLLDYDPNKKVFILRKWISKNNKFNNAGSEYNFKGAIYLTKTIEHEMENPDKSEDYKLQEFIFSENAQKRLGLESKLKSADN